MVDIASRLPDAAWFHRHRGKLSGFVFGATLQLLLVGMVSATQGGGLSDSPIVEPSPYVLF